MFSVNRATLSKSLSVSLAVGAYGTAFGAAVVVVAAAVVVVAPAAAAVVVVAPDDEPPLSLFLLHAAAISPKLTTAAMTIRPVRPVERVSRTFFPL